MADKKFTLTFDVEGNIGPIKKSINEFQSTVKNSKVKIPVNIQGNIDKTIARLTDEIENFENIAGQGFSNMAEIGKAEKSFSKISSLMKQLGKYGNQIGGLDPKKFLPKETIDRVEKLQRSWNKVNTIVQKGEANKSAIEKQTKAIKEQQEALNELATERKKLNAENVEAGRRKSGLTNKIKADTKRRDEVQSEMSELEKTKGGKSTGEYKKLSSELKVLNAQIEANRKEYTALDAAISKNKTTIAGLDVSIKDAKTSLTDMETVLQQLQQAAQNPKELEDLRQELAGLTKVNLDEIPTDLEEIRKIIESLDDAELKNIEQAFKKIQASSEDTKQAVKEAGDAFEETSKQGAEFEKTADQINRLKSQIIDFFSIGNTIQIFKSAIRDAFNTVKELDAAMTETAVVTDFSIGDMWEKLPEYSARASELGASTKSLYEATTLYYQQGLQSAEAMDVGIETMKMARIANMDAANATEAMTAALRGFNMEINETSAGRINDVYSELAAITASDTQQIATAMTKTASIAYSANMEFETTAALLAQIIETTQEAPETAGTAMKTIIARFTEVKQLFDKGMLSGEDSEGEIIDINKIDAALKTVGISLKDFLNGTKGIDDIFLELASKWDTLDLATQRYIATTAAGSRQQSRFIAMMSNYDRTMELVNAANNSAGASTEQFNKTLESLDAKLQRLNNAWQEFTMNLANNEIIKMFVDLLADGLETINSVTDALSGGNGLIKSFLTLAEVILALRAGNAIFRSIFTDFKQGKDSALFITSIAEGLGLLSKTGKDTREGWSKQFSKLIKNGEGAAGVMEKLGKVATSTKSTLGSLFIKFGPWALLIGGMAFAIYKLIQAFKAAQTSTQLEGLNKALEELGQESENVKNKISEIGNSKNNLGSLQDTLYGLTKGTSEWKQALIDVNTEVLKLIEKYPELEVTSGHYGELAISEESWDALLDKQEQIISNIGAMTAATQIQKAELETQMAYDDFITNSGYGLETKTKIIYENPIRGAQTAASLYGVTGVPIILSEQAQKTIEQAYGEYSLKEIELTEFEKSLNYFSRVGLPRFLDSQSWFGETTWGDIMTASNMAAVYSQTPLLTDNLANIHLETKEQGGYLSAAQKAVTGLVEEDFTKLSAAWYEAGLHFANNTFDEEMAYTIYKNLGFTDNQIFTSIVAEGNRLGKVFDEAAEAAYKYTNKQEQLVDNYISSATSKSEAINSVDYNDAIISLLKSIVTKEDYDTEFAKKEEYLERYYKNNDKKLKQDYAEITGKHYEAGKIWTDSTLEHELDYSTAEMIEALAQVQIQFDYQKMGETVLKGLSDANTKLFDNIFSQDGKEINARQIQQYTTEDGLDFDQITKDLGFNDLSDMAKKLNLETTELTDVLLKNFASANDRIIKQRRELAKKMTKYSPDQTDSFLDNTNILAGLENKFGEKIRDELNSVFSSLELTNDFDLISKGYEFYENFALAATSKEVQELNTLIQKLSWEDSIKLVDQLNKEILTGTKLTKEFADAILSSNGEFLSSSSQYKQFFNSEIYAEVSKELSEIYEIQEEITEQDVKTLASEYSYLNKMMKNTSTTATGLARILTSIEKGELTFNKVTDAVIAAIGGINSLGDAVSKTIKKIQELSFGEDTGEIQDFYSEWNEKLKEYQEGSEYGNTQYHNFLDYVFGPDWDKGLEGDAAIVEKMQSLTEIYQKYLGEDMYYTWEAASKGIDIFGNKVDEQALAKLNELGIVLEQVDGQITFEVPDTMTFEETYTHLQEIFGGTKELWEDLLVYFANRSPEMLRTWQLADYNQIGQRIAESETTVVGDKKIITQEEFDTVSSEASKQYSKDAETVAADIEKQLEKVDGYEVEIITTLDKDGLELDSQNIINQLYSIFGGYEGFINNFINTTNNGLKTLDFNSLLNTINSLPISSQLATQITDGIASAAMEAGNTVVYTLDGKEITLTAELVQENGGSFVSAVNSEIAEAEAATENAELDSTSTVTLNQGAWQRSVLNAKSYINNVLGNLTYTATMTVKEVVAPRNKQPSSNNTSNSNTGTQQTQANFGGGSSGGHYTQNAEGTSGANKKQQSLVGEEGPELIQSRDEAYLSGIGGPQITTLQQGDIVYTAEETKEIFRRKGKTIPAYNKGGTIGPVGGSSGGKGGGGGSSDSEEDKWENPFDKLYNLLRKIDEELRERERIERRYEKLLEGIDTSANKIIKISREELAQLEKERMLQEQLVDGRKWQIEEYQKENADLSRYAAVTENERGESVLRIDWDLIDQVTDTDQGERIEAYVNQLEEWFDTLEEAEDALWEIEDTVEEIKERGKDEYFDLEEAIKEALTQFYQEEIDTLNTINTSINDTNSSLLDAVQKSIDKQRQDRENDRTERELAEKQRRLAYLQQDTSGANALEILKLQEEIAEGQEDYTDTLIDQKISELQEQNEEAAKQREQQITLLQTQLDHYLEMGGIWEEVYALIDEGLDRDTGLVRGSTLESLLKNAEGFAGLSAIGQMEWLKETNSMIAQALAYLEVGRQLEDVGITEGSQIEFVTKDGKTMTGTVDAKGNVVGADGKTYNNVYQGVDGKYYAGENIEDVKEPVVEGVPNNSSNSSNSEAEIKNNPYGRASDVGTNYYYSRTGKTIFGGTPVKAIQWALKDMGYNPGSIDGAYGGGTSSAVKAFQRAVGISADGDYGPDTREQFRLKGYNRGGLADFTGPAWLDGTKARPEIVLDAQDSRNFIQLRDILGSLLNRGSTSSTSTENNGDITYDIDINVESIGNDYDVEQMANKVKNLIGEDARYRNNNAVSLKK